MANETSTPGFFATAVEGTTPPSESEAMARLESGYFSLSEGNSAVNAQKLSDEANQRSSLPLTEQPQEHFSNIGAHVANSSRDIPIDPSLSGNYSIDPSIIMQHPGGDLTNQVQHLGQNLEANVDKQLQHAGQHHGAATRNGNKNFSHRNLQEVSTADQDSASLQYVHNTGKDGYMGPALYDGQGQFSQPMSHLHQEEYMQPPISNPLTIDYHQRELQPHAPYPPPYATVPYPFHYAPGVANGLQGPAPSLYDQAVQQNHHLQDMVNGHNGPQGPAHSRYVPAGQQNPHSHPHPHGMANGHNGPVGHAHIALSSHHGQQRLIWGDGVAGPLGQVPVPPKDFQIRLHDEVIPQYAHAPLYQPQQPQQFQQFQQARLQHPQTQHSQQQLPPQFLQGPAEPASPPKKVAKRTATSSPARPAGVRKNVRKKTVSFDLTWEQEERHEEEDEANNEANDEASMEAIDKAIVASLTAQKPEKSWITAETQEELDANTQNLFLQPDYFVATLLEMCPMI